MHGTPPRVTTWVLKKSLVTMCKMHTACAQHRLNPIIWNARKSDVEISEKDSKILYQKIIFNWSRRATCNTPKKLKFFPEDVSCSYTRSIFSTVETYLPTIFISVHILCISFPQETQYTVYERKNITCSAFSKLLDLLNVHC